VSMRTLWASMDQLEDAGKGVLAAFRVRCFAPPRN